MTEPFPIIEVPQSEADAPEAMGTKPKFWYFECLPASRLGPICCSRSNISLSVSMPAHCWPRFR